MAPYTAHYERIPSGYMGQVVEWPEVVTEAATLDECRAMLKDALAEMVRAYHELGKPVPEPSAGSVYEPITLTA